MDPAGLHHRFNSDVRRANPPVFKGHVPACRRTGKTRPVELTKSGYSRRTCPTKCCDTWTLPNRAVGLSARAVTHANQPHILAASSNCSLVKESGGSHWEKRRVDECNEKSGAVNPLRPPDHPDVENLSRIPRPHWTSECINASVEWVYASMSATAATAADTEAAPELRRTRPTERSVAPVVRMSSTTRTCRPRIRVAAPARTA